MQDCFETLMVEEAILVILISIDIVHGDKGDMSKEENIDFWSAMFHSGKILGMFGGPPCETLAPGRALPVPGRKTRPVRSLEEPWGIPALSSKEAQQIAIGNQLLQMQVYFMWLAWHLGIPCGREHPAPHKHYSNLPDTWTLPEEETFYKGCLSINKLE